MLNFVCFNAALNCGWRVGFGLKHCLIIFSITNTFSDHNPFEPTLSKQYNPPDSPDRDKLASILELERRSLLCPLLPAFKFL
ncbi:MAG: hypothetical protein F6K35_37935 [Okeania sp. SIO2H7]|nr:hypothetical protein [Okeania sp. SIO2H7]